VFYFLCSVVIFYQQKRGGMFFMINDFVYEIPTKVYFGKNQLHNLGPELSRFGNRVLMTYGGGSVKKTGLYDKVVAEIRSAGLELFELGGIAPNPRIDSVRAGAEICKKEQIDVLLAVGGGSTIDATKWMAAGACVNFDPWKFFSDNVRVEKALPVCTVLTLAGTGSEMDGGGVITNPETHEKLGRGSKLLVPRVSFLDPTNTFTVNAYQTACGSVDMMSHIIEVYFHPQEDLEMLDNVMDGLLKTVIKYAPIAMKEPENYEARANLMWTSSWAINGFISAGKKHEWSCHPMEHELSAFYDITHGLGLAILTPRWMEYVLDDSNVDVFYRFGVNVFRIDPSLPKMDVAKKGIQALSDFFYGTLGLTSNLKNLGIGEENFSVMANKACHGNVIKGFKTLTPKDVEKIFRMCL
jgi:alcohol dehydrogenase YqhD (iron-dependent ADH family)